MNEPLTPSQLDKLSRSLHLGADKASEAMAIWLNVPSLVEFDSVEQSLIGDAVSLLGRGDETLCFCSMELTGTLTGHVILAFDDASGLSLSDLLLDRPASTATEWAELETSAALETANIIGCAYLNAMSETLISTDGQNVSLLPSPPTFRRDFAESLLQAAVMGQAMVSDFVVVARARFQIRGEQLNWHLLFVPDAESMLRLNEILSETN